MQDMTPERTALGSAVAIQRSYYDRTAAQYDAWHLKAMDEHDRSLRWIDFLFPKEQLESFLDVGAGTGRAIEFFRTRGRQIIGVEPSKALIAQSIKKGIPADCIVEADGSALPFADASFDAVCEFGVLHHVSRPDLVIAEMLRVARKAVFISDSNRYGQGSLLAKLGKLALYQSGLWPFVESLRTRGRGYHLSDLDGLFYSFSVYDHLEQLAEGAEHIWVLPVTQGGRRNKLSPLLTHGHVLLCAFKTSFAPGVGRQIS